MGMQAKHVGPVVSVQTDAPMDEEAQSEEEAQPENGQPARAVAEVRMPPADVVARHNLTHVPYAAWCKCCVQASGRENAHRGREYGYVRPGVPTVCIDYKSGSREEQGLIIGKDQSSRCVFARHYECKGSEDRWIVKEVRKEIAKLGHSRITLKGDDEPSFVAVMESVKDLRAHATHIENPPAYDPQANGAVEKGVQDVCGQMRRLRLGLEMRIGQVLPDDHPIMEWIAILACYVMNEYLEGRDGKTARERLVGRRNQLPLCEIGECVYAKVKRQVRKKNMDRNRSIWRLKIVESMWLGVDDTTGEHIVALPDGGPAVRVRTVKRMPMLSRFETSVLSQLKATPRFPNPQDRSNSTIGVPDKMVDVSE